MNHLQLIESFVKQAATELKAEGTQTWGSLSVHDWNTVAARFNHRAFVDFIIAYAEGICGQVDDEVMEATLAGLNDLLGEKYLVLRAPSP